MKRIFYRMSWTSLDVISNYLLALAHPRSLWQKGKRMCNLLPFQCPLHEQGPLIHANFWLPNKPRLLSNWLFASSIALSCVYA